MKRLILTGILLPAGTPIPTPVDTIETQADVRRIWNDLSEEQKHRLTHALGVYEGGGYQSKGVFRPVQECRMKINGFLYAVRLRQL